MKLIIIGPPGSGKGTQSKKISKHYNLKHISTGEILRSTNDKKIKETISAGKFVDDETMYDLIKDDLKGDFLLDGFPRNTEQIGYVREVDHVIFLDLPKDVCVERILARGEGREDDCAEVVVKRMDVYFETTMPVVEVYAGMGKLVRVCGVGSVDDVFGEIVRKIGFYN